MSASRLRIRGTAATLVAALLLALVPLVAGPTEPAFAGPAAVNDAAYLACGRVFADPQAYWAPGVGEATPHPGAGTSPYAKGNAPCAARTFIAYEEALAGLQYLDRRADTGPFLEVINLASTDDPRIRAALDEENGDGFSEGLPRAGGGLDQAPLYLIKVTAPEDRTLVDGVAPIPEAERDHFVWSLSVHGIERAGVEGGLRAIEDLATWGATQPDRPLLETYEPGTLTTQAGHVASNLAVGEILMRTVSYFMLPNPDGWRRGDYDRAGVGFMRFNGNGMDLNRDWPELGYVDPEHTPWSESESRTYGRVLQGLSDRWTGGIDLHGMIMANAFSYTLIGGAQRPWDKNERTMQFVEQAWADAERRLRWSPIIKPNTAPEQCAEFAGSTPTGETNAPPGCDQRSYGVQYGTIYDTIEYTATGAIGNWIDSPIGLDADGIDNEMMASHLGNCGTGTCYVADFEQLHVDGNKSLIYAMLNFSLQPPPYTFDVEGDVGYLVNPRRLVDPGVVPPQAPAGAVAPADLSGANAVHRPLATTVLAEWTVDNAAGDGTYVGGIAGQARFTNIQGESGAELDALRVQHLDPETGEWTSRPTYSTGAGYRTPGQRSDYGYPADGSYRLVLTGPVAITADWSVDFSTRPTWEQPVQDAFDVSNMDFFAELDPYVDPDEGGSLSAISVDRVLAGERNLADFDTVVVTDDALLPGYREEGDFAHQGLLDLPPTVYSAEHRDRMAAALRAFVDAGGNLVLTDDALRALEWMGVVPDGSVGTSEVYAGHVAFTDGTEETYGDLLAAGIDQPGAAEGVNSRRQVTEPLPLGYSLSTDMPQWEVDRAAWEAAGGRLVGTNDSDENRVALGEVALGAGTIRILGSFLPFPTTSNYHPFGLSSYGLTDHGYTLARNLWSWQNPSQTSAGPSGDPIAWVASDTPTRSAL